jgi:hypothetical protein
MSLATVLLLAALTYGSRAAAMVFLPRPRGRLERLLERIPGPLFAGLAALSLVTEEGGIASLPVLAAAAGALLLSPRRSLAACLIGGTAAYLIAALIT